MLVPDLVVVGSPSTDTLLIGDELREIVGGAAFITALAARAAGARVGLLGAVPPDLPESVCRAFAPGRLDPGGLVLRDGVLPAFRIDYQGEIARYTGVQQGVELQISAADLPQRWRAVPAIHLSPLGGSAAAQLRFARELRERWSGSLSIGTRVAGCCSRMRTTRRAVLDRIFMTVTGVCGTCVRQSTGKRGISLTRRPRCRGFNHPQKKNRSGLMSWCEWRRRGPGSARR